MIKEWLEKYIAHPVKNFYDYITGKFSGTETNVNLENNADFGTGEYHDEYPTNENDMF